MLLQWVGFAGGLLLAIVVHELGHFLAARWCDVKVVSFSIGFGPKLVEFTDKFGTRWQLGALLLGGSVGMRDIPSTIVLGGGGGPTDLSDSLSAKPIKQRAIIYLAGPIFSCLLAVGLAGIELVLYGGEAIGHQFLVQPDMGVVLLVSALSLSIGIFSLLPLLPLDGGRLLFLAIEAFRAKPVSDRVQTQLSRVGSIVVVLLALLLGLFEVNEMMPM
jgi:membrane-associated protease RseP (regulator of RpoE activity)